MGGNEAEEVAAAVVVTATMPGCRIGGRVGPSPVFGESLGARAQYCQKNVAHI